MVRPGAAGATLCDPIFNCSPNATQKALAGRVTSTWTRRLALDPPPQRAPGMMPRVQTLAGFEGTTISPAMICARRSSICGRMWPMNPPV
jgi:hypothetical protein